MISTSLPPQHALALTWLRCGPFTETATSMSMTDPLCTWEMNWAVAHLRGLSVAL